MANYADPVVERSLRERFRLAVESIEEGITVVESGRVVCINDRLSEILGYSRPELTRMTDLDLAAPEERKRLRQTVEELRKAQQPLKALEFWAMRKDGSRLYIRNRYVWEPDGDAVRRLVVFTADLTVQKVSPQPRAESAIPQQGPPEQMLSERESFLRQIIEADPNYVYVKDLDGRFVLVNRRYAQAFQRQPEDFLGKDNLEMRWPEEAIRGDPSQGIPDILTEERRIMESGRAKLIPRGKVWLGDRWRLMSTLKVPLRDGAGRLWGLASYIREISEAERPQVPTEMLFNVSRALAAAGTPEEMLRSIAQPAWETGAHLAMLMYVDVGEDGEPEWADVVAAIGETTAPVGSRFYVVDSPQAALLLANPDHPLFIGDMRVPHEAINAEVLRVMQSVGAHAFAVIPLRVEQGWQGVVTIAWPTLHEFSSEEQWLYRQIGPQLAASVQRQRLHKDAEHRALWSQTAAEVSQAAATVLAPDELLQRVVNLVHERFDLYYAGLFLVDQNAQGNGQCDRMAILCVGTGEAGRKMVEQEHKLEIGGSSMIGQCLETKQPRIALDVGKEAVRFANPLLPDTRTELALPLISRGQALGALSIQSTHPAAFSADDIAVLQTMADQLAIAIDNANLLRKAQARAERERRVRDIAEKIHRGADREVIMRVALEELSQMLGASRAVIRLGTQLQLGAEQVESLPAPE